MKELLELIIFTLVCLGVMGLALKVTGCTLRPVLTIQGYNHEVICPK